MRKIWKKAGIALAIGASLTVGLVSPAGADNNAPQPGQDNKPDVVLGGGSDTTYRVMQDLTTLYNGSPGCSTDNGSGSANVGLCINPTGTPAVPGTQSAPAANQGTNWDHDSVNNLYPTGSSAGVNGLIGTNGYGGQIDFARSSRGPNATGESTLNFWAYAKDGIAVFSLGSRPTLALTQLQVAKIWNCDFTTWDQVTGNPADAGKAIRVYGMNSASGTYATMNAFIKAQIATADVNKAGCGSKLQDNTYPFENDVKPILTDVTAKGWNVNDVVWFGSYAELKTYAYKAQGATFASIDGVSISNGAIANNSYPYGRFVYHVTRKADVNASGSSSDLTGATGGKGGAVRRFTQWLCKEAAWYNAGTLPANPTNAAVNPFTGATYFDGIGQAIVTSGFQRVPALERTNGACRLVPGT